MLLKKIEIENVRSFLEKKAVSLDGPISIIIGPNGGGKTNLLDTIVIMLRRYLFATKYIGQVNYGNGIFRWQMQDNQNLNNLILERHSKSTTLDQRVTIEVEVSQYDIENMRAIKSDAPELLKASNRDFELDPWRDAHQWDIEKVKKGQIISFTWTQDGLNAPSSTEGTHFLQYLQIFEFDNSIRAELGKSSLQLPLVYLPVNRAGAGFQSNVALAQYNDLDQKRSSDATFSRGGSNIIQLAVGRLARKFRLLQEESNVEARKAFRDDPNLVDLTQALKDLGYDWELATIDAATNQYDVRLSKQGSSFLVGAASSGERELLTYLFAIYALNVRDAVIIVDEPELHLHPKWQSLLFSLFDRLSKSTGNQFILATHSPTFISPSSIQYVTRVFSENQRSDVVRLDASSLPNAKHLLNVVNSQNNESIFFTDKVVLVEGLSDRIFFERVFSHLCRDNGMGEPNLEVVSVGGKGLFSAYKALLNACSVKSVVIADLDYVEQIGDDAIKALFSLDAREIKRDVIDNIKSVDGASLVARVDEAMANGSWDNAREIWEYIKSRRIELKPRRTEEEDLLLQEFLIGKRSESIYVLKRGALEKYLPSGFQSKDIEKLISLVSSDDFWSKLPIEARIEIEEISKSILEIDTQAEAALPTLS